MTKNSEIEIPLSEFCKISGDWGDSGIPNLARVFLMKCYWMLQNAKVTAFTVSKLLSKNEIPPRLGLNLGSWEIRKYQENFQTSQNDSLVPSSPAKIKILLKLTKNLWKTKIKTGRKN